MKKIKKNTEKNVEIISLNTDLYDDFFVQELEVRLETDPLMLGGLMELFSDNCPNQCIGFRDCNRHCIGYNGCPNYCNSDFYCGEY
jgi:hypothetical protein